MLDVKLAYLDAINVKSMGRLQDNAPKNVNKVKH